MTSTTLTTPMTTKDACVRALNQVMSVVVGQQQARATDHLKDDPMKRVSACVDLTMAAYKEAMATGDAKAISQLQRKADTLGSLAILATLVAEVDFGDDD